MNDEERLRRRRAERRAALRRLGVNTIRCLCGEDDPLCFEVEHVERKAVSNFVWGLCKNCHAKKSSRERSENPPIRRRVRSRERKAAHALLGQAHYLEAMTDRLRAVADLLFELGDDDETPGQ